MLWGLVSWNLLVYQSVHLSVCEQNTSWYCCVANSSSSFPAIVLELCRYYHITVILVLKCLGFESLSKPLSQLFLFPHKMNVVETCILESACITVRPSVCVQNIGIVLQTPPVVFLPFLEYYWYYHGSHCYAGVNPLPHNAAFWHTKDIQLRKKDDFPLKLENYVELAVSVKVLNSLQNGNIFDLSKMKVNFAEDKYMWL